MMSKKEAIAEAKKLEDLKIEGKKMTEEEEYRNAGISKEEAETKPHGDRGPNDLEEQIRVLKKRNAELMGISKVHRDLNGELRQEVYNLKMKVHGQVALENKIEGQKRIIEELTEDNHRLAKEIDDYVNRLRRNGQL